MRDRLQVCLVMLAGAASGACRDTAPGDPIDAAPPPDALYAESATGRR